MCWLVNSDFNNDKTIGVNGGNVSSSVDASSNGFRLVDASFILLTVLGSIPLLHTSLGEGQYS